MNFPQILTLLFFKFENEKNQESKSEFEQK